MNKRSIITLVWLFLCTMCGVSCAMESAQSAKELGIKSGSILTLQTDEYVLAGLITRESTTLGIFHVDNKEIHEIITRKIKTSTIIDFTHFVKETIDQLEQASGITVTKACFSAPGPTAANQDFMQPYYISFAINAHTIKEETKLNSVTIINDFEAIGFAFDYLDSSRIIALHQGNPRVTGSKAIVGVGTGVGSCIMTMHPATNNALVRPLGYCYTDFAPQNADELAFTDYVKKTVNAKHMSWGYALGSMAGLRTIYDFYNNNEHKTALTMHDIIEQRNIDPIAHKSVDLFMKFYARFLRTVALTQLPYGGLYITNTIAERYPELFTTPAFLNDYFACNHSILETVLKEIPVYLVQEPNVKLLGTAAYAHRN